MDKDDPNNPYNYPENQNYYEIIRGSKVWRNEHGHIHRDGDLPASIHCDGSVGYYQNGQFSRENDLPAIICRNGMVMFWKNDKFYRNENLPVWICPYDPNKRDGNGEPIPVDYGVAGYRENDWDIREERIDLEEGKRAYEEAFKTIKHIGDL
jgi:hypothetical protein